MISVDDAASLQRIFKVSYLTERGVSQENAEALTVAAIEFSKVILGMRGGHDPWSAVGIVRQALHEVTLEGHHEL